MLLKVILPKEVVKFLYLEPKTMTAAVMHPQARAVRIVWTGKHPGRQKATQLITDQARITIKMIMDIPNKAITAFSQLGRL